MSSHTLTRATPGAIPSSSPPAASAPRSNDGGIVREFPRLLATALALGLTLLTSGCVQDTAKIGIVLPLSGADKALGLESKRGFDLAQATLAEDPAGMSLELLIKDSVSDPARAAEELSALIREHRIIAAIGGITTLEARAMAPVAEEKERVLLSPSVGDQNLSAASKMVYRISHSDASAGASLATFVRNKLDLKTAMLVAQDDAYAKALREGFDDTYLSLGGEMLDSPAAGTPMAEAVATVTAPADEEAGIPGSPQAVILAGDAAWLETAIDALAEANYAGRIFGPQSLAGTEISQHLGSKVHNVLFTQTAFDPTQPNEAAKVFAERYREAYGSEATVFAAEAFDSLMVMAKALAGRPALPGEVRRGLRDQIKAYPGVTGSLEFDDTGSVSKFPRIFGFDDRLAVYDYGDWLEQEKRRNAEERRKLEERLAEIRRRAAQGAGSP